MLRTGVQVLVLTRRLQSSSRRDRTQSRRSSQSQCRSAGQRSRIPPAAYWPRLRALCDEHDILLIADEVITGFGRTGTMFGCEHWSVTPDLLTFAKGITSGYVPMGGVAVSRRVERAFAGASFMNINTYAGHPVACAAAMKTLDIIEREGLVQRAASSGQVVRDELAKIAGHAAVPTRASTLGLLGSLEFFLPANQTPTLYRRSCGKRATTAGSCCEHQRARTSSLCSSSRR